VMVIDDEIAGEGIPVAWIVCSAEDDTTTTQWMKKIVDMMGPDCLPSCIMTDCAGALANGVKAAWGSEMKHLWCTFHVKKAWKEQVLRLDASPESKADLMADLHKLQGHRDEGDFRAELESFYTKWTPRQFADFPKQETFGPKSLKMAQGKFGPKSQPSPLYYVLWLLWLLGTPIVMRAAGHPTSCPSARLVVRPRRRSAGAGLPAS
jgi:hypothetical protein